MNAPPLRLLSQSDTDSLILDHHSAGRRITEGEAEIFAAEFGIGRGRQYGTCLNLPALLEVWLTEDNPQELQ